MAERSPRTCADAANEAATYLAQYQAVTRFRPPTAREKHAAQKAENVMEGYGIPIPDSLK